MLKYMLFHGGDLCLVETAGARMAHLAGCGLTTKGMGDFRLKENQQLGNGCQYELE